MREGERRSNIVLAIDDQPENLLMLQSVLEGRGYRFLGAGSGAEGLAHCMRARPRLVLLDIQMPDIDGLAICRTIRQTIELWQMPIVFVTGRKTAEDVRAGLKAGGNDFLVKPFDPVKLIRRVEYWMHSDLERVGSERSRG
jgi:CheY-like chemotaxis protein